MSNQQIRELAHKDREQEGRPFAQLGGRREKEKAVETIEPGKAFEDDELQATADMAAGFDAPERFPKIRSS
jgi:hypothetical protein